MNRALLQQALDELRNASPDTDYGDEWQKHIAAIEALKVELAKPKPEPVAYMLTTRNFGLGGETWDTTEYRDYPWAYDCVPLYAAPTEPNCKFPVCHSQEYQDKLVQEILDEPYGYVSEHNCTGPFKHQFHLTQETIYPDNCKSITPVYTKGTTNV